MGAIIDFFEGIAKAISTAIDFLVSTLRDLVYVIQLLGKFLLSIPSYLGWLPTSIVSIIVLIFTIAVLYKILGRDG